MKENYLTPDFRKTAAERFPAETERLNAAFDARLGALRADVEQRAHGEKKSFVRLLRMPLTPDCSPNGRPRPDALFSHRAARKSVDRSRACWILTASWSSFLTTGTASSSTSSPRSTSSRSAR